MRITLLALLLMAFGLKGKAQNNKRILFVLPDSVEMIASKYIQHKDNPSLTHDLYCLLGSKGEDTCTITITSYDTAARTIIARWLSCTNRSVMIDKTEYPLLTDLDFKFGLPDDQDVGQMGKRNGYKICPLPHIYCTIVFGAVNGKVLSITSTHDAAPAE